MERQDWISFEAMAAPVGVLFGFAFGLFAGPTMTPLAQWLWIAAALMVAGFTWRGTSRGCRAARLAGEENKKNLSNIPQEIVKMLMDNDLLERIVKSKQSDNAKVENVTSYIGIVNAFGLVEEIARYLENNKLPRMRRNPATLAWGPIPWDQTPEATMARAYKDKFGGRLKALIEQFKEIGIELPQKDEVYFAPNSYSSVPLAISQIKEAATRLVGGLSAGVSDSVTRDVTYPRSVNEGIGKPNDSVDATVTRAQRRPNG